MAVALGIVVAITRGTHEGVGGGYTARGMRETQYVAELMCDVSVVLVASIDHVFCK